MKIARLAVLLVALGAGLVAAFLAMNLSSTPPPVAEQTTPTNTTEVLVAAKDIAIGSNVADGMFVWRTWPEDGLAPTYIVKSKRPNALGEMGGTVVKSTFFAGEPVTEAKLVHTDRGYMSAILPSGMRAVATTISASTGAGGFILPNDRVDVIMTRNVSMSSATSGGPEKLVPETILTNVKVLAIDQTFKDENGKQVAVGQTATLELSAEQAEILTVAQRMSEKLTLALRSLADAKSGSSGDSRRLTGRGGGGVTVVRSGVAQEVETSR